MEVVQDQHDRGLAREREQPLGDGVVEPDALFLRPQRGGGRQLRQGSAHRRNEPGEDLPTFTDFAGQLLASDRVRARAERLDPGAVGRLPVPFEAGSPQDRRAARRPWRGQLRAQEGEFPVSSDERW